MITAAVFVAGMILGIVLVVIGLAVYLKRQKAQALRPPESLGLDYSMFHTAPDPEPLQPPTVVQEAMKHLPEPYQWDGGIKIEWDHPRKINGHNLRED